MPEPPDTVSSNAKQLRVRPYLEWEGPDKDGDLIVSLRGVPGWNLAFHGKTEQDALAGLFGIMWLARLPKDLKSPWDEIHELREKLAFWED